MAPFDNLKNIHILVSFELNYDSGIEESTDIKSEIKLRTVYE